jgi:sortase (surface protein transpeptidase)
MALGFLVASFSVSVSKTVAAFNISSDTVNDNPIASSAVVQELRAVEIAAQKPIQNIAATVNIKKPMVTTAKPKVVASAPQTNRVCGGYYGYISVGGKTICLKSTNTTSGNLSYSYGYIFNNSAYNSYNQYIFAHNSASLFGNLRNLATGTRFSVTVNGQTTAYQITKKVTYCDYSNYANGAAGCRAAYPNDPVLNMYDAVNPGRQGAQLALMTCAGVSLGGGDASHRLIVYAVKI